MPSGVGTAGAEMRAFSHAPGFPPGCPDSGDVLRALTASGVPYELTLIVVTSALRDGVEEAGDHERGLDRVRASLARIGALCGPAWSPSYYGKDLVLVRPGRHDPAPLRLPSVAGGVRHGWAWDRVVLPSGPELGFDALLRVCYAVSMAARLRRDEPELPARPRGACRRPGSAHRAPDGFAARGGPGPAVRGTDGRGGGGSADAGCALRRRLAGVGGDGRGRGLAGHDRRARHRMGDGAARRQRLPAHRRERPGTAGTRLCLEGGRSPREGSSRRLPDQAASRA